jgi:hypothetical protein
MIDAAVHDPKVVFGVLHEWLRVASAGQRSILKRYRAALRTARAVRSTRTIGRPYQAALLVSAEGGRRRIAAE